MAAMSNRINRWAPWTLAGLALVARLIPGPRTIDDAYIIFRYARNLLAGNGFVYNPGQPVLATTTPLYSILMAALGAIAGGPKADFPLIALLLNAILGALSCWLLARLGSQLGAPYAGWSAAAVWAVAPMAVTFAIGGMETSLFVALLLAAYAASFGKRPTLSAAAASFALLTRPDGLLFILPLLLERLRELWFEQAGPKRRAAMARESAVFLAPLLLWGLAATVYYGSPIPTSIGAKINAYRLPPDAALVRLLQHYGTPFLGHLTFGNYWIGVGLFVFPVLFFLGALRAVRQHRRSWPLFVSPWLYFAAYAIANPLLFRWYLAPPLPFYFLGIFLGVDRIAKDTRSWLPTVGLAAAALGLTLVGWTLHPDHGPDRPAPQMAYIKLELLYQQVGEELAAELAPGQTVGAGDVGALGYYSRATIVDTLGIITPAAQHFYPTDPDFYVINYAIPPDLIRQLAPSRLVILEVYGRKGLLLDPTFVTDYKLERTIPTDIYSSRGMLIFDRVGD
jgi:arabinofuranosyltransferase